MNSAWIDDEMIFSGVKGYINTLADNMDLPPAVVIQNMLIRRIAEEDAASAVYGAGPELLIEFMGKDNELVTGQELYEILHKSKKDRLEQEYVEQLKQVPADALRPEQKELLERYNVDPESNGQEKNEITLRCEREIHDVIQYWANSLRTSKNVFIQNIVLDRLAELSAEVAVHGPKHLTLYEFAYNEDNELMTGKDLYTLRRNEYIQAYQAALDKRDKERAEEAKKV